MPSHNHPHGPRRRGDWQRPAEEPEARDPRGVPLRILEWIPADRTVMSGAPAVEADSVHVERADVVLYLPSVRSISASSLAVVRHDRFPRGGAASSAASSAVRQLGCDDGW